MDNRKNSTGPQLSAATGTQVATDTLEALEDAMAALLTALGRDVTSGPLADTPHRVATSPRDLLTP